MLKRLCIAAAAIVAVSCTAAKPPPPASPDEARTFPQGSAAPPSSGNATMSGRPAAGAYRIDSSRSELRLLVYRAGALASLGHNHVMVNRSVNGTINVAPVLAASTFSLSAAVAAFIIDDSQARSEEGEDFTGDVSDGAKSGTWNNMMGADVLNAMQYPVITVHSVRLEQSQGVFAATMTVSVAGHESNIVAPFALHTENYGLSATASFELSQSALGLTPFSIMFGALSVRDTIMVKLRVIAQLEAPH